MPDSTPDLAIPYGVLTDNVIDLLSVAGLAARVETLIETQAVPVVTTLPASASDGDEVDLRVTYPFSNTVMWRFRYDAGESTAYKWQFVGGAPLFNKRDQQGSITPGGANDWQTLAVSDAAGPAVTLPVHAYYDVRFGARIDSATAGQISQVGVSPFGSDPGSGDTASNATDRLVSVVGSWFPFDSAYAAATSLRLMYRCSGTGGTATFDVRWISVLPVKASAT